jgi:hypothetical protein
MKDYSPYTTTELAQIFWDYHKDVHGYRPHWVDLTNREVVIEWIESLDWYMESMKSTPEGLAQLREEGWMV